MASHTIFPNAEVFRYFILFEKLDLLKGVIYFLIFEPLLFSEEFGLFLVIESDPLTADGHIL
jgi:hypothetical protein